jgi:hypothetical protein
VPEEFRQGISNHLRSLRLLDREEILDFLTEEICLALVTTTPIFCTETSSWRIVDFLRRMGAKIKEKIIEYGETKAAFFHQKDARKKVLSVAVGGALVWAIGGPAAGIETWVPGATAIAIEDP